MSTEVSLLAPAIRCNFLVGTKHGAGNYQELEHKYDLLYSFSSPKEAFAKPRATLLDSAHSQSSMYRCPNESSILSNSLNSTRDRRANFHPLLSAIAMKSDRY